MSDRDSLIQKYKCLAQYKNKSDKQIEKLVDKKLAETVDDIDFTSLFKGKDLKKAKELTSKYLEQKDFDNIAEKQNLKNIIWLEIELEKNQEIINKLHLDVSKYIPEDQLRSIIPLMKQLSDLKKELGFYQKEKEESDGYKIIQRMIDRAKVWREKNQGSRTMLCPHCQKMVLMKIRTDKYDIQQHPFFEDRILTNKALIKRYCEGILSKEDVAEILEVSPDYINWLLKKWKNHPDYKEMIANKKTVDEDD